MNDARVIPRSRAALGDLTKAQVDDTTPPVPEAGLLLEPSLVETVLADLGDEPGSLPLLSHALFATWQRRRRRVLGRGRLPAGRRRAADDRPLRREGFWRAEPNSAGHRQG